MTARSTAWFARRALTTMRSRSPEPFGRLAGCVERAPARCVVSGERFTVAAAGDRVSVRAGWRAGVPVLIETSHAAVMALFDGTANLKEVLADESLVVRAGPDELLALSEAVRLFATEAATSPVYGRQFEEYRAWALDRERSR